jgi:hypothetical protein
MEIQTLDLPDHTASHLIIYDVHIHLYESLNSVMKATAVHAETLAVSCEFSAASNRDRLWFRFEVFTAVTMKNDVFGVTSQKTAFFDPDSDYVGFAVDKLARGQIFFDFASNNYEDCSIVIRGWYSRPKSGRLTK